MGRVHNWTSARNRVLVPGAAPLVPLLANTTFAEYPVWMQSSSAALLRRWTVSATGLVGSMFVAIDGGAALAFSREVTFDEIVASPGTSGGQVLSIASQQNPADVSGFDNYTVEHIACHEVPRAALQLNATDLGVSPTPFRSAQPIYEPAFDRLLTGSQEPDLGQRVLFQWTRPYQVDGVRDSSNFFATTSGTFTPVWDVALPVVARPLREDGSTRTAVSVRIFAWVTGLGATGLVRAVTNSGGAGLPVSITTLTPAWSLEFPAEVEWDDPSDPEGLQSTTFDEFQLEASVTNGTLNIAAAVAYD